MAGWPADGVDTPVGDEIAHRLGNAPLQVVGRFMEASNATLLVRLADRDPRDLGLLEADLGHALTVDDLDTSDLAVYKPARGERPLWDFPAGTLYLREAAAYEVAAALGWDLVPTTVVRADGPLGPGSVQRFVPHDPDLHYFTLLEAATPQVMSQLRSMVVFDLVIDNADRKGGHVLWEDTGGREDGRLQLVDHGVAFHVERKLRTVAWDFAGERISAALRADVDRFRERLAGDLGARLGLLLSEQELEVLEERAATVVELPQLPAPTGRRPYPWPLV